jgi:hypothetical protein
MLTSKEIFKSEQLTEEYGERRQTHFREESAGLDGPSPNGNLSALKRESLTRRLEASADDANSTSMKIELKLDQNTGEMLLVQTIFKGSGVPNTTERSSE